MALVELTNQVVTSKAPQSSVTSQDIARPYYQEADNLNRVGAVADNLSVQAAKDQAYKDLANQKVTLGPDGSVNVVNPASAPLLFGDASLAYAHAVQEGTLAQHGNIISQHLNDLHQQNPARPDLFRAAVDSWRANYPALSAQSEFGDLLRRQFNQQVTQHFNAITDTATRVDLQKNDSAISASQQDAKDNITAMLRGGASLEDPAVKQRFDQYDRAIQGRLSNPLFGYSPEQASLDRANFHADAVASRFLFDVDQTYKSKGDDGGYSGAMAKAQTILTEPAYGMSAQQREQYYHRATAEIRANEAERRQSVSEATASFHELELVSAAGGQLSSDDVEKVAKAYIDAGDAGGAARVRSAFIKKPLNDDFGRQPIAIMTQQLGALHGMNAAQGVYQAFINKGYRPEEAAGIVGNFVHESGVDPAAVGDNGTSGGIAQFHGDRLAALKAYAASQGKPATDLQTQVDFVDRELHTTESGTLAKLKSATTPEEAAAAFINYERPKGWTPDNPAGGLGYDSRIRQARAIFDGKPVDLSVGPAGALWLEANHAHVLSTAARKDWKTVTDAFDSEGVMPSPQKITDVVNAATVTHDSPLLDQIAHDSARINAFRAEGQAPLSQQAADLDELHALASQGALDPAKASTLAMLEKRKTAIEHGLAENPIGTAVTNFPDRFNPPGRIDFSTTGSLAGSLAERAAISQFARNNWQTGPLSVLDKQDVRDIQAALATPQGGQVLTTMSTALKPDELQKVFENKDLVGSLIGMQSNADPSKMSAANQLADRLWRINPAQAEAILGSNAIDKLHAWQGQKDTFNAQEIAENLNASRDPDTMRAREEMRKAGLAETEKMKAGDVAHLLGAGSWLFGGNGPLSLTPVLAPSGQQVDYHYLQDSIAGGALLDDYRQTYATLRGNGVEAGPASDLAVKRLQSTWGMTDVGGNRVMKLPPENYYPAIQGSHDWIDKDLRAWITKQAGPEFAEQPRSLEAGPAFAGREPRWEIAGLISDSQTQTEVGAHQPPSYQVVIKNSDGTLALLPRVKFDPEAPISAYSKTLEAQRQRINGARNAPLSLSQALP